MDECARAQPIFCKFHYFLTVPHVLGGVVLLLFMAAFPAGGRGCSVPDNML
jgi:hypothetical protein